MKLHKISCKKLAKSWSRKQGELKRGLDRLAVTSTPRQAEAASSPSGKLRAGPIVVRCALGRAGIRHDKKEGDHATPPGAFRLLSVFFRAERFPRQAWLLPMRRIKPSDGWCDDPRSPLYNRRVDLPCRVSHEKMWREDRLYDLVIVLNYNIRPCRKNRGSAIFLHCAGPDYMPTDGCIALRPDDLRRLLPRLSRKTVLTIR
jgi:L,D-peptidoglycan transpeptidase YkuD (ErfK/YbiS/YcfS/YnhG family)